MTDLKTSIHIPYDLMPESQNWKVGKVYRAKIVIKQTGQDQYGASFELLDASSLSDPQRGADYFMSDEGALKRY